MPSGSTPGQDFRLSHCVLVCTLIAVDYQTAGRTYHSTGNGSQRPYVATHNMLNRYAIDANQHLTRGKLDAVRIGHANRAHSLNHRLRKQPH
jgi:hypothetical protein